MKILAWLLLIAFAVAGVTYAAGFWGHLLFKLFMLGWEGI